MSSKDPKKKEISITIADGKCVVASVNTACVVAFYCTAAEERFNESTPFLHLLTAVLKLNGLGQCNTKDEVKELLGEALMWFLFMHFVHKQDGSRSIPCTWLKDHEWSNRGPDRPLDEWVSIMSGIREKTAKLSASFARYNATALAKREMMSLMTIIPLAGVVVYDRTNPGEDLRALCDMYKLSPRECFEAVVLKRVNTLEHTHKQLCGKQNQIVLSEGK